ncbi:hypothetical protein KFZ76_06940 [Methylovulum psychrotolerans]|uniref:hypothetical protein n=1 Tax=Methylovulum psychrotolerans TaxID=1704499 RepID=UPI001BFF12A1|nr:hypothetical protein [Methylovulum psychrotolerans]MBT9097446.1 hypothetical protein [Methylovulum psychrotolerans]
MILCDDCKYETSEYVVACEHCGQPSRFPNVIAANKKEELTKVNADYAHALSVAEESVKPILQSFENAVNKSNAILVRPIHEVCVLFENLNSVHQTFHQRLRSGGITMSENEYDVNRPTVDAKLFPTYSDKITFAALSLNSLGAIKYGCCHMTLKTNMIEHRSSIFQGNSYHILSRLGISVDKDVPKGLRTTWALRGRLAISKLASFLKTDTIHSEFQSLLINDDDLMEVHIFGNISHHTIAEITINVSNTNEIEKHFVLALQKKIQELKNSINNWDTKFTEI